MMMARAPQAYQQTQVLGSDPRRLVILMCQALVRFLERAERAIQRRDFEAKADALYRAQAVLSELECSLDAAAGGELAASLRRFYAGLARRIAEVDLRDDLELLGEVIAGARRLADTWEEALRLCLEAEREQRAG